MRTEEKQRIRDETYRLFRGGGDILSQDIMLHYKKGRLGVHKPTLEQPAALGAWLAGRDDAKDGIEQKRK